MFKTKQKILITFLFTIILTAGFTGSVFAREVKVFYNGREIIYDVPTEIVSDYVMMPLSETLEFVYNQGTTFDPTTMLSTFHANGHVYTHTVGSNTMYIDGFAIEYNRPSQIAENEALVPTQMIADITGYDVQWDHENYHILISGPPAVVPTQAPTVPMHSVSAEVISADLSKDTITEGETVIITIKTNNSANYVWVDDGSEIIPVMREHESHTGIKTWVLLYKASKDTNLYIFASTAGQIPGVATKNLALTVNPHNLTGTDAYHYYNHIQCCPDSYNNHIQYCSCTNHNRY